MIIALWLPQKKPEKGLIENDLQAGPFLTEFIHFFFAEFGVIAFDVFQLHKAFQW